MLEVIDKIGQSRGWYYRTGYPDAGGEVELGAGGAGAGRSARRAAGGGGRVNDLQLAAEDRVGDDSSFGGSDLGQDLERELARRSAKKTAKRCAAAAAICLALVAIVLLTGRRGPLLSPGGLGGPPPPEGGPPPPGEDGGGIVDDELDAFNAAGADHDHDEEEEDAVPVPAADEPEAAEGMEVEEGMEEIEDLAALFEAAQALPPYKRCPPPLDRDREDEDGAVFHIGDFRIVPEDDPDDNDNEGWQYSLSDMDVSDDASIIAVGMGDYAADTGYEVGMVRAFAYSCDKGWKRLGQDLLGGHEYEMFGHRVSSNGDGTVLAVAAPQKSYDGGRGFVEVFSLDEDTGRWEPLGSRVDSLEKAEDDYSMLGHAVDLSDGGETLAVLGIVDDEYQDPSYVVRVFDYDYRKGEWGRKGHDLVIANVTFGRDYSYKYSPQVSLSDKGDRLIVTDPQMGVVTYNFHFSYNRWKRKDSRTPKWNDDLDEEFWISSLDLDDKGDLVAFSAFEETEDGIVDAVKIVDFQQDGDGGGSVPVDVYARDFRGWEVDLSVAVSDRGNVAAFVASKIDVDDVDWWDSFEYGVSYGPEIVGALTVVTKYEGDETWSVVGEGTEAESLGVLGSQVSLSGDGRIAAVGYNTIVALYGISLDRPDPAGTASEVGATAPAAPAGQEDGDGNKTAAAGICTPFPNATSADGPLGSIDDLPRAEEGEEQHTLSLSLSADGSIVAVGIDSFDGEYRGEDRGLVRTFAWSCEEGRYLRLGRDLLGSHEFDGFGQSVDLDASGRTLAVGANQPPPGKSGYVDVYELRGDDWVVAGQRVKVFSEGVSDVGRGVHLSDDGETLMILGSVVLSDYESSFLRVLRKEDGKWASMGDDILSSVEYDDYGTSAHATLSGDGNTLAVTGSYSQFFAKLYRFDEVASNWTETVIPPPNSCMDDDPGNDSEDTYYDDGLDYYYQCYFTGEDIAVNGAATSLAVAGTSFESSGGEIATVRVLTEDPATGNFTLGEDPIDFAADYFVSSVDISDDGRHLAVGIDDHSDDLEGQGQGASFAAGDAGEWVGVAKVDGANRTDLLGARVRVAGDGRLAAASSRRGYITFFRAA